MAMPSSNRPLPPRERLFRVHPYDGLRVSPWLIEQLQRDAEEAIAYEALLRMPEEMRAFVRVFRGMSVPASPADAQRSVFEETERWE